MNMKMSKDIPLYTRTGTKVTAILLILFGFMIIKNCAGSIYYGAKTDPETQQHYYARGFTNGSQVAQGLAQTPVPTFVNPVLEKAYNKGFQVGWDSVHKAGVSEPERPAATTTR